MLFRIVNCFAVMVAILGVVLTAPLQAQEVQEPADVDAALHKRTVDQAVTFLLEKGQDPTDGSFSKQLSIAVTAMSATALIRNDVPVTTAKVQKAIQYVLRHVREDGGIYSKNSTLKNYETSLAVLCLVEANKNGRYDDIIQKATDFLTSIQWDGAEGHALNSAFYGGWGYGKHKRPDASNSGFTLDALIAAGVDPKSTPFQKNLVFNSRTQNLASEHNTLDFAQKVDEENRGGFIYSPANGGETKAGELSNGGLRSYASMTYAGLKSFLYAGLSKEDARVQAAFDWIQRHYDLESNPGMGAQGLYYYYHVFAKALHVLGEPTLTDAEGNVHNWRAELVQKLSEVQQTDGSFANAETRWMEGDQNLSTCYALLALSYCKPGADSNSDQ
jgi:squalene-hopene/tetraprenyl-beta-curcumene cyclase